MPSRKRARAGKPVARPLVLNDDNVIRVTQKNVDSFLRILNLRRNNQYRDRFIAAEEKFEEFINGPLHDWFVRIPTSKLQTIHSHCGTLWTPGTLCYRCRTCSSDPSTSICIDCFAAHGHVGHDANISCANGGCCDCGDTDILSPESCCSLHQGKTTPSELIDNSIKATLFSVIRILCKLMKHIFLLLARITPTPSEIWVYFSSLFLKHSEPKPLEFYIKNSDILNSISVNALPRLPSYRFVNENVEPFPDLDIDDDDDDDGNGDDDEDRDDDRDRDPSNALSILLANLSRVPMTSEIRLVSHSSSEDSEMEIEDSSGGDDLQFQLLDSDMTGDNSSDDSMLYDWNSDSDISDLDGSAFEMTSFSNFEKLSYRDRFVNLVNQKMSTLKHNAARIDDLAVFANLCLRFLTRLMKTNGDALTYVIGKLLCERDPKSISIQELIVLRHEIFSSKTQDLHNMLFCLLRDNDFKAVFSRTFAQLYPLTAAVSYYRDGNLSLPLVDFAVQCFHGRILTQPPELPLHMAVRNILLAEYSYVSIHSTDRKFYNKTLTTPPKVFNHNYHKKANIWAILDTFSYLATDGLIFPVLLGCPAFLNAFCEVLSLLQSTVTTMWQQGEHVIIETPFNHYATIFQLEEKINNLMKRHDILKHLSINKIRNAMAVIADAVIHSIATITDCSTDSNGIPKLSRHSLRESWVGFGFPLSHLFISVLHSAMQMRRSEKLSRLFEEYNEKIESVEKSMRAKLNSNPVHHTRLFEVNEKGELVQIKGEEENVDNEEEKKEEKETKRVTRKVRRNKEEKNDKSKEEKNDKSKEENASTHTENDSKVDKNNTIDSNKPEKSELSNAVVTEEMLKMSLMEFTPTPCCYFSCCVEEERIVMFPSQPIEPPNEEETNDENISSSSQLSPSFVFPNLQDLFEPLLLEYVSDSLCESALNTLALMGQVGARMWARNGDTFCSVVNSFCSGNSIIVKDLFALQLCGAVNGISYMIDEFLCRLEINSSSVFQSIEKKKMKKKNEKDENGEIETNKDTQTLIKLKQSRKVSALCYHALWTILNVYLERFYVCEHNEENLKWIETRNISAQLCYANRAFSELFLATGTNERLLSEILSNIAIYRPPTATSSGTYTPNEKAWEMYDPLCCGYDSVMLSGSLERFKEYCKLKSLPCPQIPLSPHTFTSPNMLQFFPSFESVSSVCSSYHTRQLVSSILYGGCLGVITTDAVALALHVLNHDVTHSLGKHSPLRFTEKDVESFSHSQFENCKFIPKTIQCLNNNTNSLQCQCGCSDIEDFLTVSFIDVKNEYVQSIQHNNQSITLLDLVLELSVRNDGIAILAQTVLRTIEKVSEKVANFIAQSQSVRRRKEAEKALTEKRAKAKARQEEIMRQMNEKRSQFAKIHTEELSTTNSNARSVSPPSDTLFEVHSPTDSKKKTLHIPFPFSSVHDTKEGAPVCVLCREECSLESSREKPFGLVAHVEKTKILNVSHALAGKNSARQKAFTILSNLIPSYLPETKSNNKRKAKKNTRSQSKTNPPKKLKKDRLFFDDADYDFDYFEDEDNHTKAHTKTSIKIDDLATNAINGRTLSTNKQHFKLFQTALVSRTMSETNEHGTMYEDEIETEPSIYTEYTRQFFPEVVTSLDEFLCIQCDRRSLAADNLGTLTHSLSHGNCCISDKYLSGTETDGKGSGNETGNGSSAVSSCRHLMHIVCYERFIEEMINDETLLDMVDADYNEYPCPLCKRLSNSLIPLAFSQLDTCEESVPESVVEYNEKRLFEAFQSAQNISGSPITFPELMILPSFPKTHVHTDDWFLGFRKEFEILREKVLALREDVISMALCNGCLVEVDYNERFGSQREQMKYIQNVSSALFYGCDYSNQMLTYLESLPKLSDLKDKKNHEQIRKSEFSELQKIKKSLCEIFNKITFSFHWVSEAIASIVNVESVERSYQSLLKKRSLVRFSVLKLLHVLQIAYSEDSPDSSSLTHLTFSLPCAIRSLSATVSVAELRARSNCALSDAIHKPDRLLFYALFTSIVEAIKESNSLFHFSSLFHLIFSLRLNQYPIDVTYPKKSILGSEMFVFFCWYMCVYFADSTYNSNANSKTNSSSPPPNSARTDLRLITSFDLSAPLSGFVDPEETSRSDLYRDHAVLIPTARISLVNKKTGPSNLPLTGRKYLFAVFERLNATPHSVAALCVFGEIIRSIISSAVIGFDSDVLSSKVAMKMPSFQTMSSTEICKSALEDLGFDFERFLPKFFTTFTNESFLNNDDVTPRSAANIEFVFAQSFREYCTPYLRCAVLLLSSIGFSGDCPKQMNGNPTSVSDLSDEYFSSFFPENEMNEAQRKLIEEMRTNGLRNELLNIDRSDNFVALLDYLQIPHFPCFFVTSLSKKPEEPLDKVRIALSETESVPVDEILWGLFHSDTAFSFLSTRLFSFTTVKRAAPFRLVKLPNDYDSLLHCAMNSKCSKCERVPERPALCLTCGRYLCNFSDCCINYSMMGERVGELASHAYFCCSVGAFLIIRRCLVIVTAPAKGIYLQNFESIYLDKHGESDPDLVRGRPLFLSQTRYDALRDLLLQLRVEDHCAKDNAQGRSPAMMFA